MSDLNDQQSLSAPTGEHDPEQTIRRTIHFARYEIEVELTKSGQFKGIVSVKVNKDFTETIKSKINPNVHDVEKYYSKE